MIQNKPLLSAFSIVCALFLCFTCIPIRRVEANAAQIDRQEYFLGEFEDELKNNSAEHMFYIALAAAGDNTHDIVTYAAGSVVSFIEYEDYILLDCIPTVFYRVDERSNSKVKLSGRFDLRIYSDSVYYSTDKRYYKFLQGSYGDTGQIYRCLDFSVPETAPQDGLFLKPKYNFPDGSFCNVNSHSGDLYTGISNYYDPPSDDTASDKEIDGLEDILSVVKDIDKRLKKLPQDIFNILALFFVVDNLDNTKFKEVSELFMSTFAFVFQLIELGDVLLSFDYSEEVPIFPPLKFGDTEMQIVDWSLAEPFLPYVKDLMSGIILYVYIRKLRKKLPNIINGSGGSS